MKRDDILIVILLILWIITWFVGMSFIMGSFLNAVIVTGIIVLLMLSIYD